MPHMTSTLKIWLRKTARRLCNPFSSLLDGSPPATSPNDNELEMMDLSRLVAEIAETDLKLPDGPEKDGIIAKMVEKTRQLALSVTSTENEGQSSSSSTGVSKSFALSPSLRPEQCSTAPEICLWAGSLSFRRHFEQLARAVYSAKGTGSQDAIRKVAIMNVAYRQRWYWVYENEDFNYPPGTTGRKVPLRKLPLGAKGFKLTGKWAAPVKEEDFYVPEYGVVRKHEHRPPNGRWYYPRPSSLRIELEQT